MNTATTDRFDAAVEMKNMYSVLTAARPARTMMERPKSFKMTPGEVLGEVYAVLSLVVVLGVLAYQIVAS